MEGSDEDNGDPVSSSIFKKKKKKALRFIAVSDGLPVTMGTNNSEGLTMLKFL